MAEQKTDRGFISNNPGIVAAVVATLIGAGFLFLVIQGGTHHEGGAAHGGAPAHSAAPAAEHH